jgi:hypothetical protein
MKTIFSILITLVVFSTTILKAQPYCDAVYSDNNVVLAAVDNKLYRSTDNGQTFTHIQPAGEDNIGVRCIASVNNTLIIGAIQGSRIFRSTDNGLNWTVSNTGMPAIVGVCSAVPAWALTTGSKVFMGGTNFFRVSEDDGQTWNIMSYDEATGGLGLAAGKVWHSKPLGGPGLKYSSDLGVTWLSPPSGPSTYGYPAVGFAQFGDTLVVLSSDNGGSAIKRSPDNGITWQSVSCPLGLGRHMIEVNDTLYATAYGGFYISIDHGLTWTAECDSFQWHNYGGKLYAHGDDIWIASANGPVRYSISTGTCSVVDISTASGIDNFSLNSSILVYPNPAKESVTINNLPIGSTVSILDVTGKTVYSSVTTNEQLTTINMTDFTNGIYLIRIDNNGNSANRKFVVNK